MVHLSLHLYLPVSFLDKILIPKILAVGEAVAQPTWIRVRVPHMSR